MVQPEGETNLMVNKYLELCHTLGNQGHKVFFSLSNEFIFSFSLNTKEKNTSKDTKDKSLSMDPFPL